MERLRRFASNVLAVAYREGSVMRHDKAFIGVVTVAADHDAAALRRRALERTGERPVGRARPEPERRLRAASSRRSSATGYFLAPQRVASYDEGRALLARGEAIALVVIPHDFQRDSVARPPADAGAARRRRSAHRGARRRHHRPGGAPLRRRICAASSRAAPTGPPLANGSAGLQTRPRFWFNPTLRDRDFFLAALAGMLLTNLCFSASSLGLVGERESGTYEQTLALPTSPLEIVLGKLVPYVGVCYVVLAIAILGAGIVFGDLAERELARDAARSRCPSCSPRSRSACWSRRWPTAARRPSSSRSSSSCPRSCSRA